MAKRLSSYTFPSGRGRGTTYDYDSLLDGSPWELVQGEDFQSKVESFISSAGQAARKRNMVLRSHRKNETTVVIQAFPKT